MWNNIKRITLSPINAFINNKKSRPNLLLISYLGLSCVSLILLRDFELKNGLLNNLLVIVVVLILGVIWGFIESAFWYFFGKVYKGKARYNEVLLAVCYSKIPLTFGIVPGILAVILNKNTIMGETFVALHVILDLYSLFLYFYFIKKVEKWNKKTITFAILTIISIVVIIFSLIVASVKPKTLYLNIGESQMVFNAFTDYYTDNNEINNFLKVATKMNNEKIIKWDTSIRLLVQGEYTKRDLEQINRVVDRINQIQNKSKIEIVNSGENMKLVFGKKEMLKNYDKGIESSEEFIRIWWNYRYQIYKGIILINSEIDETSKYHYITLNIIKSLGMVENLDGLKEDSIFNTNKKYNTMKELDERFIMFLYSEKVKAGMDHKDIIKLYKEMYFNKNKLYEKKNYKI